MQPIGGNTVSAGNSRAGSSSSSDGDLISDFLQEGFQPPEGAGFDEILGDFQFTGSQTDTAQLFMLQQRVNKENLYWNAMSNVVKVRHDASMNAIRNVKG
ncbi:MAG: hypothetical protein AAF899_11710 [Pseudomonadota bacterium]